MDPHVISFADQLTAAPQLAGKDLSRAIRRTRWIAEASPEQVAELLELLANRSDWSSLSVLEVVTAALGQLTVRSNSFASDIAEAWLPAIRQLAERLPPSSTPQVALLAWLAKDGTAAAMPLWLDLVLAHPPDDERSLAQMFAPLFQRRDDVPATLFPRLFAGLAHPLVAAATLDLANYLYRSQRVPVHPAAERSSELIQLFGQLTRSLEKFEESPPEDRSGAELSRMVSQSVALIVSLCDTLGLVGDKEAIGRLSQALDLKHRRIRTEAAAALARLGDDRGKEELPSLAVEPSARLRVLQYCQELGIADRVDPEYATPLAVAEAELVVWLAEPTQFGIPPTEIELVEHRQQHWPGYNDAKDCFLFRFTYRLTIDGVGERSYSNVGIAGPLAYAFTADMGDLPPADIFAAFAGFQAEHADIFDVEVDRLSKSEQLEAVRLERRLHDAGFQEIQPFFMGYFLGEKALAATCLREGVPGAAVADFSEVFFFPARNAQRPLGPREAHCIYKGRKLLKAFNRDDQVNESVDE